MALPFDATLKDLVQRYPQDWLVGLKLSVGGPVEVLTPDLSTVTAFTDLVLKVGERLLHLDFQTGPDPSLPRRMLLYNVLLHHRYETPVHSVVVLLRPRADRSDLSEWVRYEAWPGRGGMSFRFDVIRVWEQPMEALLAGPLGILPLAPLGQIPEGSRLEEVLPGVVERLVERVVQETAFPQAAELLTASFVLTGLRLPREQVLVLFQGVRAMHESSTYQYILEEGEAKGLAKGIQTTLLRLGARHLGAPTSETQAAIKTIIDLEHLARLTNRLLDVKSWQELLETP